MLGSMNDSPAAAISRISSESMNFTKKQNSATSNKKKETRCLVDQTGQATALYLAHRMCRKRPDNP
jgi:hypothetical protein